MRLTRSRPGKSRSANTKYPVGTGQIAFGQHKRPGRDRVNRVRPMRDTRSGPPSEHPRHRSGRSRPPLCAVTPSIWPVETTPLRSHAIDLAGRDHPSAQSHHRSGRSGPPLCAVTPSSWPVGTTLLSSHAIDLAGRDHLSEQSRHRSGRSGPPSEVKNDLGGRSRPALEVRNDLGGRSPTGLGGEK